MFCSNCGKEVSGSSKFCPFCGQTLDTQNDNNIVQQKMTPENRSLVNNNNVSVNNQPTTDSYPPPPKTHINFVPFIIGIIVLILCVCIAHEYKMSKYDVVIGNKLGISGICQSSVDFNKDDKKDYRVQFIIKNISRKDISISLDNFYLRDMWLKECNLPLRLDSFSLGDVSYDFYKVGALSEIDKNDIATSFVSGTPVLNYLPTGEKSDIITLEPGKRLLVTLVFMDEYSDATELIDIGKEKKSIIYKGELNDSTNKDKDYFFAEEYEGCIANLNNLEYKEYYKSNDY